MFFLFCIQQINVHYPLTIFKTMLHVLQILNHTEFLIYTWLQFGEKKLQNFIFSFSFHDLVYIQTHTDIKTYECIIYLYCIADKHIYI